MGPGTAGPGMGGPGTAELQLGIAMANPGMAGPGTAELQLGIAMANLERPTPEPPQGWHPCPRHERDGNSF